MRPDGLVDLRTVKWRGAGAGAGAVCLTAMVELEGEPGLCYQSNRVYLVEVDSPELKSDIDRCQGR